MIIKVVQVFTNQAVLISDLRKRLMTCDGIFGRSGEMRRTNRV